MRCCVGIDARQSVCDRDRSILSTNALLTGNIPALPHRFNSVLSSTSGGSRENTRENTLEPPPHTLGSRVLGGGRKLWPVVLLEGTATLNIMVVIWLTGGPPTKHCG